MSDWSIEWLAARHDRREFDCGKPDLSDWLRHHAGQFVARDLCRVHIATREGDLRVLGYYAMSSYQVRFDDLPTGFIKRLPRLPIPAVLIGKMAVDISVQRCGLGRYLLMSALRNAQHLADRAGTAAVVVHAIDDEVRGFYEKYGFRPLTDDPRHLFMPMKLVRKLDLPPLI